MVMEVAGNVRAARLACVGYRRRYERGTQRGGDGHRDSCLREFVLHELWVPLVSEVCPWIFCSSRWFDVLTTLTTLCKRFMALFLRL